MRYTLIIGTILAIVSILIILHIFRKKIYDTVDRLELWKMEIMNRNTASELARVKGLNISGEVQEKFESWKNRWEYIITNQLPETQDYLFAAEDAADRFRFKKSHELLQKVEEILNAVDEDINKILQELDRLLEVDESTRKKVEELHPILDDLYQQMIQKSYQFGKAAHKFEKAILKNKEKLQSYKGYVAQGDYYKGQEIVDTIETETRRLVEQMEAMPSVLNKCKKELPKQLEELLAGIKEMEQEGYPVHSFKFDEEIKRYENQLHKAVERLETGDTSEVDVLINEIETRIQNIYDQLEEEAIAKNYLEVQIPSYEKRLSSLRETFKQTQKEVDHLQQTYYFEDQDMERYLMLDKTLTKLTNLIQEIVSDRSTENTSFTELRTRLEHALDELESLVEEHDAFSTYIRNLRKEELQAQAKLRHMQQEINQLHRKLRQSNIPGVPNHIWDMLTEASKANQQVIQSLEAQPLDMGKVNRALDGAEKTLERAVEQTNEMLDQAYLTEQIIQYANRYRSRYPLLAAKLIESERLFRSFQYELSLEHAAKAIEEIEPGALKQIEANQELIKNL